VCKICVSNGPTEEEDVIELEGNLHLWVLDKDTYGTDVTDFVEPLWDAQGMVV
jgi:hypothetical protein